IHGRRERPRSCFTRWRCHPGLELLSCCRMDVFPGDTSDENSCTYLRSTGPQMPHRATCLSVCSAISGELMPAASSCKTSSSGQWRYGVELIWPPPGSSVSADLYAIVLRQNNLAPARVATAAEQRVPRRLLHRN